MLKRHLLGGVTTAGLLIGGLAIFPGVALAHTPNVTANCSGVKVDLKSYETPATNNRVTVTIGGVVQSFDFGASFNQTFAVPQGGATTAWSVVIDANRTNTQNQTTYDRSFSGNVGPCGQTSTTTSTTSSTTSTTTTTAEPPASTTSTSTTSTSTTTSTTEPPASTSTTTTTSEPPGSTTTTTTDPPGSSTTTTTDPPEVFPPTTPPATLTIEALQPVCFNDTPYIQYRVAVTGTSNTTAKLTFRDLDGNIVGVYENQPLQGTVIYPGASVEPLDWPGWKIAQNGNWERDPSDARLRDGLTITVEVNATATGTVSYPPPWARCVDPLVQSAPPAPPVTAPAGGLPVTGGSAGRTLALAALCLALGTAVVVAVRRRPKHA